MKLFDFGFNEYSQDQEDGMIAEVFERIGTRSRRCVEFGAADGLQSSNTARLWRGDWDALLIEADEELHGQLWANAVGFPATCLHRKVRSKGDDSIDKIVGDHGWPEVDFMSIDVDGADYLIWEHMGIRPRLISIEYNRSVPAHVALRQAAEDDHFGQSAAALIDLGRQKGYEFVGLTSCNLLFVVAEEAEAFSDLDRDLGSLFDHFALTYLVTDYLGNVACLGDPPWGVAGSYLGELVGAPNHLLVSVPEMTGRLEDLRQAYEMVYGRSVFIGAGWHNVARPESAAEKLADVLRLDPFLVLIDISFVTDFGALGWIKAMATERGYSHRQHGQVLIALLRSEEP